MMNLVLFKAPRPGRAAAALALAVALAAAAPSALSARPTPESFADLAAEVSPAVVNISVERQPAGQVAFDDHEATPMEPDGPFREFMERFFGRQAPEFGMPHRMPGPQRMTALGSGFLIDPEGYVVTNSHVIQGAARMTVTLEDGRELEGELVGSDPRSDLALIKVEAGEPLPFVSFGDSDAVRVGDWVMTVGNPFGLGGTVTAGIVSARGRDLRGGSLVDYLQIDAPINQGNSGGPAFNGDGQVVGVNTAIYSPNGGNIGIGFAIPSNTAKQVVDDLRRYGEVKRGWLGVAIQPVTPDIAEGFGLATPRGALVTTVEPDSPAAAAGLKAGDVVLAWDGKPVEKLKDLPRLVAATQAGVEVAVTLWRGGRETEVTVVTGASRPQRLAALENGEPSATVLRDAGLSVVELTPERRQRLGLDDRTEGVLVAEIEPGSQAMKAGLRPGDLIREAAQEPVSSTAQLQDKLAASRAAGKRVVPLLVTRGGDSRFVALAVGQA